MLGLGTNIAYPEGSTGLTAVLDGVNDELRTPIGGSGDASFTFSIWFKRTGGASYVFGEQSNKFKIQFNTVGNQALLTYWNNIYLMNAGADPTDGLWHNLVVYYDHAQYNDFLVWWDGQPLGVATPLGSDNTNTGFTHPLIFGGLSTTDDWMAGEVQHIAAWDAKLTDAQVLKIYQLGRSANLINNSGNYTAAGDLTHFYRMGDGEGDLPSSWEEGAGANQVFIANQVSPSSQLGADLIYNGSFETGTTLGNTGSGWLKVENYGTVDYEAGGVELDKTDSQPVELSLEARASDGGAITVDKHALYQFTHTVIGKSGASYLMHLTDPFSLQAWHTLSEGATVSATPYKSYFYSNLENKFAFTQSLFASSITIDNVSLKKVGNGTGMVATGGVQFK